MLAGGDCVKRWPGAVLERPVGPAVGRADDVARPTCSPEDRWRGRRDGVEGLCRPRGLRGPRGTAVRSGSDESTIAYNPDLRGRDRHDRVELRGRARGDRRPVRATVDGLQDGPAGSAGICRGCVDCRHSVQGGCAAGRLLGPGGATVGRLEDDPAIADGPRCGTGYRRDGSKNRRHRGCLCRPGRTAVDGSQNVASVANDPAGGGIHHVHAAQDPLRRRLLALPRAAAVVGVQDGPARAHGPAVRGVHERLGIEGVALRCRVLPIPVLVKRGTGGDVCGRNHRDHESDNEQGAGNPGRRPWKVEDKAVARPLRAPPLAFAPQAVHLLVFARNQLSADTLSAQRQMTRGRPLARGSHLILQAVYLNFGVSAGSCPNGGVRARPQPRSVSHTPALAMLSIRFAPALQPVTLLSAGAPRALKPKPGAVQSGPSSGGVPWVARVYAGLPDVDQGVGRRERIGHGRHVAQWHDPGVEVGRESREVGELHAAVDAG